MAKYRKKPVVVEAIPWTGGNYYEISQFVGTHGCYFSQKEELMIKTLEGEHVASQGDMILRGVQGECYPCKLDIFEQTYEKVE